MSDVAHLPACTLTPAQRQAVLQAHSAHLAYLAEQLAVLTAFTNDDAELGFLDTAIASVENAAQNARAASRVAEDVSRQRRQCADVGSHE